MKSMKKQKTITQKKTKKSSSVRAKRTWAQFANASELQKSRNRNFDNVEWTWEFNDNLTSKNFVSPNSIHLGEILKEFYLKPLQLTTQSAASKIEISKRDLFAILRKKAKISLDIANKLAKAFKTTSRYWINMQDNFNSTKSSNKRPSSLKTVKDGRE